MPPKLRTCERDQIAIMMLSIDDLLPPDHEVRSLWAYVEGMDLTVLLGKIANNRGKGGAPAYDPRVLLALWLYATSQGVGSARELEQLCREFTPFRWLCGDDAPNYHTLSDFRTDHGPLLDTLLSENLALLVSEGLIVPEDMTVAHDGLRVRASAGRGSYRRRPTLEEALREARERVEALKAQTMPSTKRRLAAKERAAREREERVAKALVKMKELEGKRRTKLRKEARASTTDPDAMRMKMPNGGIDPGFNMQFTTDTNSRVITAVAVGDCGSDYGLLSPAVKQHRRRLGKAPRRLLADAGYVKSDDIIALDAMGCDALVPDVRGRTKRGSKHPAAERWHARMENEDMKHLYKTARPATAEWANAQLRNRGLYSITVRGKAKALVVALWHALTHNILRTISLRKSAQAIA